MCIRITKACIMPTDYLRFLVTLKVHCLWMNWSFDERKYQEK